MNHELIKTSNKKEDIIAKIKDADMNKAILFCNKKRDIEALAKAINEAELKALFLYNGLEEKVIEETVDTFNKGRKIFLVCSDSIAKKVDLRDVCFVIGTELPTRANDYKTRMTYMKDDGTAFTFHNGEDDEKVAEINRIMEGKPRTQSQPIKAKEQPTETQKTSAPKKATIQKSSFGGDIPDFLKVDVSHLIKGD